MFSLKSKIFITGATGFVGSYIVRRLVEEGYENIYCLHRTSSDKSLLQDAKDRVQWMEGDIMNIPLLLEQMSSMDVVIHAAAMVTFHPKEKKKIIEIAMQGTANMVNAALECNVQKFIHISSIAAIGRRKKQEDIHEKLIFSHSEFDTTYGLAKFLAEQEVWRGHAEGLPVIILNPSMILGAGFWNSSSIQIFTKIYDGLQYYPSGTNGWVDVRDVAKAASLSLKSAINGKRYIISAENVSFRHMFEKIAKGLHVKAPYKNIPSWLEGIAWRIEVVRSYITGQNSIITKETIKSTSVNAKYDNTLSINELGMNYLPLEKSIQESVAAFLDTWPQGKTWAILKP